MPLSKLVFKTGINKDQTNYASEGGWYDIQLARFRSGFPEKFGGWKVKTTSAYIGTARSIFPWSAFDGNDIAMVGTNQRIYLVAGTSIYDITPIRATYTSPSTNNCLTPQYNTKTVLVTITGHGGTNGDTVIISGATGPVGGIPASELNGEHVISNCTTDTFKFTTTTTATGTVAGGGTAIEAEFLISPGTATSTYGYGWSAGGWGRNGWGSGSTNPIYFPARIVFGDNYGSNLVFNIIQGALYYWEYDATFTSRAILMADVPGAIAVPEEINKVLFTPQGYLLACGCSAYNVVEETGATISSITHSYATATLTTATAHGLATNDWVTLIGQSPADYSGQFQVTVTGTNTFTYEMAIDPGSNATVVGTYYWDNYGGGDYDPLLIRWSNVDADAGPQPQVWNPTPTNSSGFLRISAGSNIVTATNTRQETLIFTNVSLHSLQFLGTNEIFGLQQMSSNISILGPNAVTSTNNIVYWMGSDRFYVYTGRVDVLPCTVRQYVFDNINLTQGDIVTAGVNNKFGEIIWFYCSANSTTIDRYVIFNYLENIWYYGTLARTAWVDSGAFPFPLAANNGWIYTHENGTDDGQPNGAAPLGMTSYITSADVDISDGDKFMLLRRVIPDVNFTGSESTNPVTGAKIIPQATITVGVRNFPGAASSSVNTEGNVTAGNVVTTTATIDQYTNQIFIRARGRQMNFTIGSTGVGTQWQLGLPRIDARPDGMRS